MKVPMAVPRLVLGAGSLELPARATRDRSLDLAARLREPESLAVALVKGVESGADAIIAPPTSAIRGALDALARPLPLLVRVPLVPPADDLRWEPELVEAGEGGLLAPWFGPDLAARVTTRTAADLARWPAASVRGVVVAWSQVDLALAAGHARFFERVLKAFRRRHGLVGFETRNLGHLLSRLTEWGLAPDFVVGPLNPAGLDMRPDAASVLGAVAASSVPVIATEIRAGGIVPLEAGAAFALEHGVWGVMPELVELEDVAGELRTLASRVRAARAAS